MEPYKNQTFTLWRMLSLGLRALAGMLRLWPVFLLAALFVFPTSPHLRMHYSYEQRVSTRYFIDCRYLGVHGWIEYSQYGECPLIMMFNKQR